MQRFSGLAAGPLRGAWRSVPGPRLAGNRHRTWAWGCAGLLTGLTGGRRPMLPGQRALSSGNSGGGQSGISVVGTPDPITWVRCRLVQYLIKFQFGLDLDSEEFQRGVKQALVHVSDLMSSSSYHRMVGLVSTETIEHVRTKCGALSNAQRRQLAVSTDDIIFMLPEDVSVVFDEYHRKFCFVVMRFWFLSTCEGPDDPEATKVFRVDSSQDGVLRRRIVTAVYEFKRELTVGASPDWTVTTIWHWHWRQAET